MQVTSQRRFGDVLMSAEKQTVYFYGVQLYKAGALFGKNRVKTEKVIEHQKKEEERLKQSPPYISDLRIKPDGRRVYQTIVGFGPGGASTIVFSKIGDYDVALLQMVDFQDDTPEDEMIKNPAEPRKDCLRFSGN